jgi:cytochrome P450
MNIPNNNEQQLNPFQFYAEMRHNSPVAYDDRNNVWGVFRYYDVHYILGDYTHFSSNPPPKLPNQGKQQNMPFTHPSLLKSDPPYHRTLRGVIASAFTPMAISKLEPRKSSMRYRAIIVIVIFISGYRLSIFFCTLLFWLLS